MPLMAASTLQVRALDRLRYLPVGRVGKVVSRYDSLSLRPPLATTGHLLEMECLEQPNRQVENGGYYALESTHVCNTPFRLLPP
jgi:hypothetical protein